jgi:hypothetical protein
MVTTLKHQVKDSAKVIEGRPILGRSHEAETNMEETSEELTRVIEQQDQELMELRENTLSTHLAEIDVELKVYKDECTQLRRLLEEVLMQLKQGAAPSDVA